MDKAVDKNKECLIYLEIPSSEIKHIFTYEEWWNDVWDNSCEYTDDCWYYYIEPLFDPMDTRIVDHPEMEKYGLSVYNLDALFKYPYIKRAIEHDEVKKTWENPSEEETTEH
jgi:hypothetical protein